MSLTAPTTTDLLLHLQRDSWRPGSEERFAQEALLDAVAYLELASGTTTDPTEVTPLRIVRRGILTMAHYILVRRADEEIEFNIFSSERIGSYSYQKAAAGEKSGIAAFDLAVGILNGDVTADAWSSSERVFVEPYLDANMADWWGRDVKLTRDAFGR